MTLNLPIVTAADISNKKVIVRADLDVAPENIADALRIQSLLPTLDLLAENAAQITLIGHRGRPDGHDASLSMKPLETGLSQLLSKRWGSEKLSSVNLKIYENLRFNQGEEENNEDYAAELASDCDFYVNEAFSVSHREHTSIVTLPRLLPHAAGIRFGAEVKALGILLSEPEKPLVAILSGVKKDKLNYVEKFKQFADKILIAGRLPDFLEDENPLWKDPQVIVGRLIPDKEDITIHTIETFENEIAGAGTVLISGPMGRYEDEGHSQGTKRVLEKAAASAAYKVAGGGDTETAIAKFGLVEKFDWISVGGGAMLEFLSCGTLPGIEALVD